MLFTKRHPFPRFLALAVILLLFMKTAPIPSAKSAEPSPAADLEDLWIDMRIGQPLIALFNEVANSDDIARVDHPSQVEQLAQITDGRKMVIFKSVAETEQILLDMGNDIDVIGYNLEHGQTTPEEEKADPVGSIKKMRELADEYGLELALGPDHDFALSHGVEMAPFVDIFVLQIQRQQTNPQVVKDFVVPLVPQLREANPDIQVSVQVRTEGDVQALVTLLASLKPYLDGISILTSPDTVEIAEELLFSLRPSAAQPAQGANQYSIYLLLGIVALILIAGFLILRRRK